MKNPEFTQIIKENFSNRNRVLTEDVVNGLTSVMQFGLDLLFKAQIFHIWHLSCTVMNEHLVLKDLYDSTEDFSDGIIEAVTGITDQIASDAEKVYKISIDPYSKDMAIQSILEIKNEGVGLMNQLENEEGIKNIFAGYIDKLDGIVYKMKRFTA